MKAKDPWAKLDSSDSRPEAWVPWARLAGLGCAGCKSKADHLRIGPRWPPSIPVLLELPPIWAGLISSGLRSQLGQASWPALTADEKHSPLGQVSRLTAKLAGLGCTGCQSQVDHFHKLVPDGHLSPPGTPAYSCQVQSPTGLRNQLANQPQTNLPAKSQWDLSYNHKGELKLQKSNYNACIKSKIWREKVTLRSCSYIYDLRGQQRD